MISTFTRVPRRISAGHLSNSSNDYYNASYTQSTPLHRYVKSSDIENISKLISSGIDVDARDGLGMTPLMLAIVVTGNASAVELLLNANADIHATDSRGESVLSMAIENSNRWLYRESRVGYKILDLIFKRVKKDFFIDKESTIRKLQDASCPISLIPFMGDAEITKYFLTRADDFSEFYGGTTILHVAVIRKDIENVKVLVDYLADINDVVDDNHQTALFAHNMQTADSTDEEIEILKILLDCGASLNVVDKWGTTPMELFLNTGNRNTRMTVLKSNALRKCLPNGGAALHYLLKNDRIGKTLEEEMKVLLDAGFDINKCDKEGKSALTYVIDHHDSFVIFLLDNGAKVNWPQIVGKTSILYELASDKSASESEIKRYQKIINIIFQHQLGIKVKRLFRELNGSSKKLDRIFYAHIVIAQMTIALAAGETIPPNPYRYNKTANPLHFQFKQHFEICKERIKQLKTVEVYDSVSLYDFLILSDAEINKHVYKQTFLSELQNLINQEDYKHLYYVIIIRKRVENALETMDLRIKCGRRVCQLTGLDKYGLHGDHRVTSKIIDYLNLSKGDLLNFCESQATSLPKPNGPNFTNGLGSLVTKTIKKMFS